jgi:hypothetical protein
MSEPTLDPAPDVNTLLDAYNELRNRALGRGTSPNVSSKLTDDIETTVAGYRQWAQSTASLAAAVVRSELRGWVARYNTLSERVAEQLGGAARAFEDPALTPVTDVARAAGQAVRAGVAEVASPLGTAALGAAAVVAVLLWLRRR